MLDTFIQAFRIAETVNVPVMVCYDGFLLSQPSCRSTCPSRPPIDAFLPPRPAPLQVVDLADPRNIGQVTLADPRVNAERVSHGYMELRALHQRALLQALEVVPAVDAQYGEVTGRSWGGLFWEDRLGDADIALVAAGSLATQLTVPVDALRAKGIKAGVLGIRAYRPFPGRGAARRAGRPQGRARLRQGAVVRLRRPHLQRPRPPCAAAPTRRRCSAPSPRLGGRDTHARRPGRRPRRALADHSAGVRDRADDWLTLKL